MTGMSWSEHVRLELAAEWASTQEAEWRRVIRRDRRRRALRWCNPFKQVVCDPGVAVTAPGAGLPASPPGAVSGMSGAASTLTAHPPGRQQPHRRPGHPTH